MVWFQQLSFVTLWQTWVKNLLTSKSMKWSERLILTVMDTLITKSLLEWWWQDDLLQIQNDDILISLSSILSFCLFFYTFWWSFDPCWFGIKFETYSKMYEILYIFEIDQITMRYFWILSFILNRVENKKYGRFLETNCWHVYRAHRKAQNDWKASFKTTIQIYLWYHHINIQEN